jgi:hypothetical protein
MTYMLEFISPNGKLLKRVNVADKNLAMRYADIYLEDHPKHTVHMHLKLSESGYVREKAMKKRK